MLSVSVIVFSKVGTFLEMFIKPLTRGAENRKLHMIDMIRLRINRAAVSWHVAICTLVAFLLSNLCIGTCAITLGSTWVTCCRAMI